jgi:hypothetical protein
VGSKGIGRSLKKSILLYRNSFPIIPQNERNGTFVLFYSKRIQPGTKRYVETPICGIMVKEKYPAGKGGSSSSPAL